MDLWLEDFGNSTEIVIVVGWCEPQFFKDKIDQGWGAESGKWFSEEVCIQFVLWSCEKVASVSSYTP